MKKTLNLFIVSLLFAFTFDVSSAQNPTYNLTAKNFTLNDPAGNELEFDIYIQHTNSNPFEYSAGQYWLSINPDIFPCGPVSDTTNMTYKLIGSDLPLLMQPRHVSIATATNPTATVLRTAVNSFPGSGNGYIMTGNGFPGTKIARMQLKLYCGQFNQQFLGLAWRNPPILVSTKVFAYVGTINTDITTPQTHTIDSSGLNGQVLPVELANFSSTINRNNVTLNWTTTKEINNSGFDIERKLASAYEWTHVDNVSGNGNSDERHNYTYTGRVNTGKYNYRLKQTDFNGNFSYFNLANEVEVGVPHEYNLSQNYPNPFNPATKIDYDLPYDGKVSIILYDISGREVASLVNEVKTAGYYTIQFNASSASGGLASGMYFYKMAVQGNNNFSSTKKMALIK